MANNAGTDRDEEVAAAARDAAKTLNADILLINHYIGASLDKKAYVEAVRKERRDHLYLVLITEGGDAHTGYRCMRFLQSIYKKITVVVPGWCKSAGTLMCTGAHQLQMGPLGELGPLDVQLMRRDSLREVSSGLAVDTAIEKLQMEASKVLMNFIRDAEESDYRMSLTTAAEIAQTVTIGLFQPVFAKLEPISIGEDYRSYKIAEAYADRLNRHARNLQRGRDYDGLQALLEAFPSHGFVIDLPEARSIFNKVDQIDLSLAGLLGKLGSEALFPLDRDAGRNVIKYLDVPEKVGGNVAKTRKSARARQPSSGPPSPGPGTPSGGQTRASGNPKTGNGAAPRK
jgi:Serine dehydrogenase proteinase